MRLLKESEIRRLKEVAHGPLVFEFNGEGAVQEEFFEGFNTSFYAYWDTFLDTIIEGFGYDDEELFEELDADIQSHNDATREERAKAKFESYEGYGEIVQACYEDFLEESFPLHSGSHSQSEAYKSLIDIAEMFEDISLSEVYDVLGEAREYKLEFSDGRKSITLNFKDTEFSPELSGKPTLLDLLDILDVEYNSDIKIYADSHLHDFVNIVIDGDDSKEILLMPAR